jgi:hypothetical protein
MKLLMLSLVLTVISCSQLTSNNDLKLREPTLTIDQLVEGWPEMISAIKSESNRVPSLNGRVFNLRVILDGDWNLRVTPERAFTIERGTRENTFTATIINPYVLFDSQGGLSKMTYVQAELSKAGGQQGAIELTSDVECLYRVRFFQESGGMVDFTKLSEAYDYDFLITPSGSLGIHSMTPTSVIFARPLSREEIASVQVQLTSKDRREMYLSNPVVVPRCFGGLTSAQEEQIKRTPGLCVRHLQTLGERWEDGKRPVFDIAEVFGNVCDRAVQCRMPARYGLVKNQQIVKAKDHAVTFAVPAQSHIEVDMSMTLTSEEQFDSKLYIGSYLSKAATPIGYNPNQFRDLECEWQD